MRQGRGGGSGGADGSSGRGGGEAEVIYDRCAFLQNREGDTAGTRAADLTHTEDPFQSAGSVKCLRYQPSPRGRKPCVGLFAGSCLPVISMSCGASTTAQPASLKPTVLAGGLGGLGPAPAITPATRSFSCTRGTLMVLVQQSCVSVFQSQAAQVAEDAHLGLRGG